MIGTNTNWVEETNYGNALRFAAFKVLKSLKPIYPKERIYLNLYHFATGDSNSNSALESESLIYPGPTYSIPNQPTYYRELNILDKKRCFLNHKKKVKLTTDLKSECLVILLLFFSLIAIDSIQQTTELR